MRYTLEETLRVFVPYTEMPPSVKMLKEKLSVPVFTDMSSNIVITGTKLINFSDALKLPNMRQNRGAQPRTRQHQPKFGVDHQPPQQRLHLRQNSEEVVNWDRPEVTDNFNDLLCPDFRTAPKPQKGKAEPKAINVMDLPDEISGKVSTDPKQQQAKDQSASSAMKEADGDGAHQGQPQGKSAGGSVNAIDAPKIAFPSTQEDDIESVLTRIEADSVSGNTTNAIPQTAGMPVPVPTHEMSNFAMPPVADLSMFGAPAIQYSSGIPAGPDIASMQSQLMYTMYQQPQPMVGIGGMYSGMPGMPIQNIAGIYQMQMAQSQQQQQPQLQQVSVPMNDVRWEYLDLNNVIQGPFSNQMMQEWYKNGSLPENLRIRRYGDTGAFVSLIERWAKSLARGFAPFSTAPSESSYQ